MKNVNEEMSFEELLNEFDNNNQKLDKTVTGKIIAITEQGDIFVDVGCKMDGLITKNEYSYDINDNPKDKLVVGDLITADVIKFNDGNGNILLSYKRVKQREGLEKFEQRVKNNEIFEEKITQIIDKGFVVIYQGVRIFIPFSLSCVSRDEEIQEYKDKIIKFKIIEYDRNNRKIIGSVRAVSEDRNKESQESFWEEIEKGKEYLGTVTSLSSYGAFVQIGPVQGLLHVSEITWSKNANVNELLNVGDKIKVKVKVLDKENKKVLLTCDTKGEDPWFNIDPKYNVGDVLDVKVVKFMAFGAFVELEHGIEGLIHISQIATYRIGTPSEILQIGQIVKAKIIELDKENKKIELSIKEVELDTKREEANNND